MNNMYSKSQPQKNATLCMERMSNQLDICCLNAAQDNDLYPTNETERHSRFDDLLWAPVDGHRAATQFVPDCAYCNETASGRQFSYYQCDRRERRQLRPRDYGKHTAVAAEAATQKCHKHSGHERHRRRKAPTECDCRQRGNNDCEQRLAPLPTASFEPTAPPADDMSSRYKPTTNPAPLMPGKACKQFIYQQSCADDQKVNPKQTSNQVTQTSDEQMDNHEPRHHITKELPPPADGPNLKRHKHGRNRHVQLPPENRLPKRADYHRAEEMSLPKDKRKHGHAHKTSHNDYLVLYKNDYFDNDSSVERNRKPQKLADVRSECKKNAIGKPSVTPLGLKSINAKIYDIYNADSNGTSALQQSQIADTTGRQAVLQGSADGSKLNIGTPGKSTQKKQEETSAPTLSTATGFTLSAEDIIDAKVTAPMVRRVQRIYRANLAEQMMLVKELGSIPRLVRETLEKVITH